MTSTAFARSPTARPQPLKALVAAKDWSTTPLGPRDAWPRSLRAIVDLILESPIPMIVLWGDELIQVYNDGYAVIAADKHPKALGQPTAECWPEVWSFNGPIYDKVRTGESFLFQDQHMALLINGAPREFWFDLSYSPVRDDANRVSGVLVTVVDTTLRVRLAQQLEAERESVREANRMLVGESHFLRKLFHLAPSFMAVLRGPDHVFDLVNEPYVRLIGGREVQGMTVRAALPEVAGQGFFELLDQVYATGRPHVGKRVPVRLQRRPGAAMEERVIDFVYQPITDEDGQARGVFVDGFDVTEHVRTERALRDLNETLEEQVEARTRELRAAEEALRQAQKMEAVGQLTGGLAHDFNNLLAGIVGSLEMLQTRIGQGRIDQLDRYIQAAATSANRAATLTHRLLTFSRRQTLDPRPIEVRALIASMDELIRRTLGPAIRVETSMADGLWATFCDPNQLENSLLNLAINARDALPVSGRVRIEAENAHLDQAMVQHVPDLAPGDYVRIAIVDDGVGMDQDTLERVFDPFFTTKPIGQGTGLGLSMVYGFVRQSHGHVAIESALGEGTTVSLYLPRHAGPVTASGATAGEDAPRAQAGEQVLVVDDEPVVRMLVSDVLRELGYAAIEVAEAATALRVLDSRTRIDLLVTDVGLPGGLNGRQLADAARVRRPGLKVLFITGYAESTVLGGDGLEPGMEVITKPFTVDVLATRIRSMIGV